MADVITPQELAGYQADYARALIERGVITRRGVISPVTGLETSARVVVATQVPVDVHDLSGVGTPQRFQNGGTLNMKVEEARGIAVPVGTDLRIGDHVEVGTRTYRIVNIVADSSIELDLVAEAELVLR